jgi:splicing factor 3B subunit 4
MYGGLPEAKNQEATVFVGELMAEVTEALLWELMAQAGPVVSVHIPRDKVNDAHSGYGFVEFATERDAEYAMRVMNQIKLFGRPIRVNRSNANRRTADVGANLFVGNLDPSVEERTLYETFGRFGTLLALPKIMRDETGQSRGFAFVSFDSFAAADAAIEGMNGQFLANKPVTVAYAFKKDSRSERHGTRAERLLEEKQRATRQPIAVPMPMPVVPLALAIPTPIGAPIGTTSFIPSIVPTPMTSSQASTTLPPN